LFLKKKQKGFPLQSGLKEKGLGKKKRISVGKYSKMKMQNFKVFWRSNKSPFGDWGAYFSFPTNTITQ